MRIAFLLIAAAALAGCGSDAPPAAPATDLTVHVAVFGGPMRPDGGMAASNVPQRGARITITDSSGRAWSARTDRGGIASFAVPDGKYVVHAPCQPADPAPVLVRAGNPVRMQVRCYVP